MSEAVVNGVLSIAPNAVCDEDKELLAEARERHNVLSQRVAKRQEVIREATDWARNRDDVGALLSILNRDCD